MDFKILNFTIFCVNNVASFLNKSAKDVYHAMQNAGMIDGYIVPCYDVLHSFSKEYIVDDLVSLMRQKGVQLWFFITPHTRKFLNRTCFILVLASISELAFTLLLCVRRQSVMVSVLSDADRRVLWISMNSRSARNVPAKYFLPMMVSDYLAIRIGQISSF